MQTELFPHRADLMVKFFDKLHLGLYPVEMMSYQCLGGQTNHAHWYHLSEICSRPTWEI